MSRMQKQQMQMSNTKTQWPCHRNSYHNLKQISKRKNRRTNKCQKAWLWRLLLQFHHPDHQTAALSMTPTMFTQTVPQKSSLASLPIHNVPPVLWSSSVSFIPCLAHGPFWQPPSQNGISIMAKQSSDVIQHAPKFIRLVFHVHEAQKMAASVCVSV